MNDSFLTLLGKATPKISLTRKFLIISLVYLTFSIILVLSGKQLLNLVREHRYLFDYQLPKHFCVPRADGKFIKQLSQVFLNPESLRASQQLVLEARRTVDKENISMILPFLKVPDTEEIVLKAKCGKCVVVGSGHCLTSHPSRKLGKLIDSYDVVIRTNKNELGNFSEFTGSKTDIRFVYPESVPSQSAFFNSVDGLGLMFVLLYRPRDVFWIRDVFNGWKVSKDEFEMSVPEKLPVPNSNVFIVNPDVSGIQEFLKKRPTAGTVAVYIALSFCGSVDVAGMCYNKQNYTRYFDSKSLALKFISHDTQAETLFRRVLLKDNYVQTDITGGFTG